MLPYRYPQKQKQGEWVSVGVRDCHVYAIAPVIGDSGLGVIINLRQCDRHVEPLSLLLSYTFYPFCHLNYIKSDL